MWDVEAFLAATRFTSWRVELGAPPMRGAIWLNNAGTELHWWNLDTDAAYMQFDVGGSSNDDANMIYISSIKPSCIDFLDGIIYFGISDGGGGGAWKIDFLRDEAIGWFASGQRRYSGNIEERNDGNGNVSTRTSVQIINGTVNFVNAVRDPSLVDVFDRPKHWWAVSTQQSGTTPLISVYNPVDDAIYDGGRFGSGVDAASRPLAIGPNGAMGWVVKLAGKDYIGYLPTIYAIDADWEYYYLYMSTVSTGANLMPFSVSWVSVDMAMYNGAFSDIQIVAGNEGLLFIYPHNSTSANNLGAVLAITSSYNTPYMKGARVCAYPLNDVNDRSGNGHTLTNNNTVTFATGGPTGNYADFVAASSQYLTLADHANFGGMSELTISCWINRDIDAGADAGILGKFSTTDGSNQSFRLVLYHGGGDTIIFEIDTSVADYSVESVGIPVLGEWLHIAATYDGANMKIYTNGVHEATTAATGTIEDSAEQFNIGCSSGGGSTSNFFDGQIAGVWVGKSALTEAEIQFEYQRGVRMLGGATAVLANSNVTSVRVDQNTGLAAITTAANQVEIWDVNLGLRESINATTTATLNDADVRLPEGADEPLYIMGRSGQIGVVAPDRRLLG